MSEKMKTECVCFSEMKRDAAVLRPGGHAGIRRVAGAWPWPAVLLSSVHPGAPARSVALGAGTPTLPDFQTTSWSQREATAVM